MRLRYKFKFVNSTSASQATTQARSQKKKGTFRVEDNRVVTNKEGATTLRRLGYTGRCE